MRAKGDALGALNAVLGATLGLVGSARRRVGSDAEVCWEHERGCWEHEWGCWERSQGSRPLVRELTSHSTIRYEWTVSGKAAGDRVEVGVWTDGVG